MYVRTTLIIDDKLLDRAKLLTGIEEKTALVRAALEALIAREAGRRLAMLGGTEPGLKPVPRRKSESDLAKSSVLTHPSVAGNPAKPPLARARKFSELTK
jgi:hypothetical protein